MNKLDAQGVLTLLNDEGILMVDLRFCDITGQMQHFSVPASQFQLSSFRDGFAFDGSAVRGFQQVHESDLVLIPDAGTAVQDSLRRHPTVSVHCFIKDPQTGEPYNRDPRFVALKAEEYVAKTGLADAAYFGPETQFMLLEPGAVPSAAASACTLPLPPADKYQDLRSEIALTLETVGVHVESHSEIGGSGRAEIDIRFASLLDVADNVMLYKYVVENVAHREDVFATFEPQGSAGALQMHIHQSLWNGETPLFYEADVYANLSDIGRWYTGGLLRHARSLMAFTAPSPYWYEHTDDVQAPVDLVYSQRNRSAVCRIPVIGNHPEGSRVDFRSADSSANPYLAFSALLMAGLDGVANRIEPPDPFEHDAFHATAADLEGIAQVPATIDEALDALENDNLYLKMGGVFTDDVIAAYIANKRSQTRL